MIPACVAYMLRWTVKTIPQRELRNDIARVLRDVEAGEHIRVTVDGRPVADLIPVDQQRRTFVPREQVEAILRVAQADPGLTRELNEASGSTIDEL